MARVAIIVAALLAALVAGGPWIGYAVGLGMIDGGPTLPVAEHLSPAELEFLHVTLRKSGALNVPTLSPWDYARGLLLDPDLLSSGGVAAASIVARDHNASHLKGRGKIWWRLSGAALTVWLTRNWTSDQILARAFEIERARPR